MLQRRLHRVPPGVIDEIAAVGHFSLSKLSDACLVNFDLAPDLIAARRAAIGKHRVGAHSFEHSDRIIHGGRKHPAVRETYLNMHVERFLADA
jgi:hypothetical protein